MAVARTFLINQSHISYGFFLQSNLTSYFLSGFVDSVSLLGYSLQKAGLPSGVKEAVNTGNSRTNPSSSGPSPLSSSPSRNISEFFLKITSRSLKLATQGKTLHTFFIALSHFLLHFRPLSNSFSFLEKPKIFLCVHL